MKTLNLIIILMNAIFIIASAQESTNSIDPNKSYIKFEKLIHDYGTIETNSDGNCEFIFTNEGDSNLILSNVTATCGCTVPKWPQNPIKKGEKGSINVRYNTKIIGAFNKTIIVYSNGSEKPVTLRIKGQVKTK
jgi:hypothetical protein